MADILNSVRYKKVNNKGAVSSELRQTRVSVQGGRTESAIIATLKKRHGCEIQLIQFQWL